MRHLHFGSLEKGNQAVLPTDEHDEMLADIRDRDVGRADALARAHGRQLRENVITCMTHDYLKNAPFAILGPAA